jgi:hypothetical protein
VMAGDPNSKSNPARAKAGDLVGAHWHLADIAWHEANMLVHPLRVARALLRSNRSRS